MNKVEVKVLRLFLMSRGLSTTEVEDIISNATLVERTVDSAGFYTTVKILPSYKDIFINSQEWSDAIGCTQTGIEVGFVIFPPNEFNNIIIEGFTYGEEYSDKETDYEIFSISKNNNFLII